MKAKEKMSAWRRKNRLTEGGCHHADLAIASGTECVKAKEKGKSGYIQRREQEGGRWREAALRA